MALGEDHQAPYNALIRSGERWSYSRLAKHLVEHGGEGVAPVTKDGFFYTAVGMAVTEIRKLAPKTEKVDLWVYAVLAYMMEKMKIHFVPWHKPSLGRGSAPRLVHHEHWLMLDRAGSGESQRQMEESSSQSEVTQITDQAADEDESAPWIIPESLEEMDVLWKKTGLPDDWNIDHASLGLLRQREDALYVCETYDWVASVYDGGLWKHHMGLVWAVLFTTILPEVFFPTEKKSELSTLKGKEVVTREIRRLEWVKTQTTKHKGVTAPAPYITMLSTAIIAMLEDQSPLQKYIKGHKNAFGGPWTDKHGERLRTCKIKVDMELMTLVRIRRNKRDQWGDVHPDWVGIWD